MRAGAFWIDRKLALDIDVLTRISAVLGIHQAVGILFKTAAESITWLRGPHQATVFGGQIPLALIASGDKDNLLTIGLVVIGLAPTLPVCIGMGGEKQSAIS